MHITITGNLGSGKSTLAKLFSKEYGYEIFSTGKVIRHIAEEHGLTVLEMNALMEKDHSYDHEIDDTTARLSRENPEKKILFDSRLAWHFVESSFKVFLSVSLEVAAARVFADAQRGEVETYSTVEDAKEQLRKRALTEDRRYRDIYDIEYFHYENYNLVLDSTDCTPEILALILYDEAKQYENKLKVGKGGGTRLILSPQRDMSEFAGELARGTSETKVLFGKQFHIIEIPSTK